MTSFFWRGRIFLILFATVFFLSGCSSFGCCVTSKIEGDETVHYIVVGIGVVSIPKLQGNTGVMATRVNALGAVVSDQPGLKFGMGAVSSSTVEVKKGAKDVRLEISQTPFGKMELKAKNVEFNKEEGRQ